MSLRRLVCPAVLIATVALGAGAPAQAAPNPYSPEQVCGAGFGVVGKHKMVPKRGKRVRLATAYLLYDQSSGRNCAVVMKHRAVGRPSWTAVSLQRKGRRQAWIVDYGQFSYYAGPVYKKARGRCVRYGASLKLPSGRSSLFISKFGHCGS